MQVLSGDTQKMAGSVKYFLLEWFIKTDGGATITANYFVRTSIPFKVTKLAKTMPESI